MHRSLPPPLTSCPLALPLQLHCAPSAAPAAVVPSLVSCIRLLNAKLAVLWPILSPFDKLAPASICPLIDGGLW